MVSTLGFDPKSASSTLVPPANWKILQTEEHESERYKNQYCSYEIRIVCDKGILIIDGCHDMGPDIRMFKGEEYD